MQTSSSRARNLGTVSQARTSVLDLLPIPALKRHIDKLRRQDARLALHTRKIRIVRLQHQLPTCSRNICSRILAAEIIYGMESRSPTLRLSSNCVSITTQRMFCQDHSSNLPKPPETGEHFLRQHLSSNCLHFTSIASPHCSDVTNLRAKTDGHISIKLVLKSFNPFSFVNYVSASE